MSLEENAMHTPFFVQLWEDLPTVQDESATQSARRAALARAARRYVDLFMAVGAFDVTADPGLQIVSSADDIAFGRSDCDFVFRD